MNEIRRKLEEYLNDYEGGYAHRSALRWLFSRNSELWNSIVQATDFLPKDALPKQRAWHILNEIYERPTCPVTGEFVKWWENRYLEHISRSAMNKDPKVIQKKLDTYKERTGYDHWHLNPEVNEKYNETFKKNREEGNHIIVPSPFADPKIQEQIRQDCLDKYGVDNHSKRPEVRAMLIDPNRDEKLRYREEVTYWTRKSWNEHFDEINPKRLVRGDKYHLDHIFSIDEGFKQGIPAEMIGNWTNLQMLTKFENDSKGTACWKTKEKLFEDFDEDIAA